MADAAPMENHHPPGTPIVTPATPAGPEATHENENNNAAVDPENEQVQELESELSKLKVSLTEGFPLLIWNRELDFFP